MIEINNKTKSKIDLALIKKLVEKFLKLYNKKGFDISIAFIGDAAMRALNKKYRKKDKPTDVLSFSGERKFLGEVIIDYAQIKRQAKVYKNSVQRELIFILVHGLLHLIGFNDKIEKGRREMENLGNKFVDKILKK
jgi:probable rRNA maturation factor